MLILPTLSIFHLSLLFFLVIVLILLTHFEISFNLEKKGRFLLCKESNTTLTFTHPPLQSQQLRNGELTPDVELYVNHDRQQSDHLELGQRYQGIHPNCLSLGPPSNHPCNGMCRYPCLWQTIEVSNPVPASFSPAWHCYCYVTMDS